MNVGGAVLFGETLPNNWTSLPYCFCSGPTSVKFLGTLFILSPNKVICAIVSIGSGGGGFVAFAVKSG